MNDSDPVATPAGAADEPGTAGEADPADRSSTIATAHPAEKPAAEPETAAHPAGETVAEPQTADSSEKPAAEPETAAHPAKDTAAHPAKDTAAHPAEDTADHPAEETVAEPQTVGDSAGKPAGEAGTGGDPAGAAVAEPPAALPHIPHPRVPVHDVLPPAPAAPPRWRGRTVVAVAVVLLLAATTVLSLVTAKPHVGLLGAAPAAAATPTLPPTPYALAEKALSEQAAALLRQDHAGWMAAVDPGQPALRKHFELLYTALQALHVTQFEYHDSLGGSATDPVEINAVMSFCLSTPSCPEYQGNSNYGPPWIAEKLSLQELDGHYVISKFGSAKYRSDLQPYPWETDSLSYAQGKLVTVGASRSLAGKLSSVVAVADKAAVTDNRFADLMANPQQRYRIFLADDKAWKTWYGGDNPKYAVAFTISTGGVGSDVVVHMSQLRMADLKVVVQHEMGHVATLSNVAYDDDSDMWLKEGVAEYIGWLPQQTRQAWEFPFVQDGLHGGRPPKTIVEPPLAASASDRAANRFYGLAHFAVECMVDQYGEAPAMNFVRLRLRAAEDLDVAARTAFGKPFATVDKGCLSWMKQHS